jgi:hypothetical protein
MLLAAGSCGHWIAACCSLSGSATWNRLGGPLAAGGVAIDVTAFIRVRKARTTVNPLDPSEATRLATDRPFPDRRNPMCLGLVVLSNRIGGLAAAPASGSFHRCW